jgi:hypothetical protein
MLNPYLFKQYNVLWKQNCQSYTEIYYVVVFMITIDKFNAIVFKKISIDNYYKILNI